MMFLDANIILRYLTRDDPVKAERCFNLLKKADRGEIELITSEAVIAEVVYVLSSPKVYAVSRERIRSLLIPIISLRGLKLSSRKLYLRALDLYAALAIDFEDALAVAHMERHGISQTLSYDAHFDRVAGIERCEP